MDPQSITLSFRPNGKELYYSAIVGKKERDIRFDDFSLDS